MRIVLDANVYVSALINPDGIPGRILTKILEDESMEVVLSPPIFDELRRVLDYPKVRNTLNYTESEVKNILTAIKLLAVWVKGETTINIDLEDPDDAIYIWAAIETGAEYIVTGDQHLLRLEQVEDIRCITPRGFMTLIR